MIKKLRNSKLNQKKDKILNYMYQFSILEDYLISQPALYKELKYELDEIVYSLIGAGLKTIEAT